MLAEGRSVISLDDVENAHEHIQRMSNDAELGLHAPLTNVPITDADDAPVIEVTTTKESSVEK
jgi:hypothetical protein